MSANGRAPWWKGERGEWLVVAQLVVMLLVAIGPRTIPGFAEWSLPSRAARLWLGAVFVLSGGVLVSAGGLRLGAGLTPLPYPKADAPLVQDGPYRIVRHPVYSGLLIGSAGVALVSSGWLTWAYVAALFVLLDIKTRAEERWLSAKFAEYAAYQRRVRKLLPLIY
jgi:protein-S-isoprenylcysteine O-methyltransferase Ste14